MVAQASRISSTLPSQIDVLSDVNEPEIVDSGELPASHFFCQVSSFCSGG